MGDIDGLTGTMANVSAYTIKNSTGLVLPYDVWHSEIRKDINIYEKVAQTSPLNKKVTSKRFWLVSRWI